MYGPVETKAQGETIPAIEDIVNQIHAQFKVKSVCRIHSDKAQELRGPTVKGYFREKGIWTPRTAGYVPNSNPNAEGVVGVATPRARAMLAGLGRDAL